MFVLDLQTHNNQKFAEAYTARFFDKNRLRDRRDGELTTDELVIEKENVTVFNGSNGNLVMNLPNYISENYEGDGGKYIDKDGGEIVSSYRLLLVAHNSSGFDNWVVLNSSIKLITELKNIKTARGLISLSFWCGAEINNTYEVPQNVNFTSSKSHIKGPLEKIGREYGLQPELLKGELNARFLLGVILLI